MNLPASRLTALLVVIAAALLPKADAGDGWRAVLARREKTSLAECRLAGGGDGRRARDRAGRAAQLWRHDGRIRLSWATPAGGSHGGGHSPRAELFCVADALLMALWQTSPDC